MVMKEYEPTEMTLYIQCPFSKDSCNTNCAWYCPGEKCCSIKLIAMELMKSREDTSCQ